MAFTFGFYDSMNHDRIYNSLQFGSIFDGVLNDGVYKGFLNEFKVTPSGVNQIKIDTGRAWFDHTWNLNDPVMYKDLPDPDVRLDRYDMVVIEVNRTLNTRKNDIKIISGEAGSPPNKPVIVRDGNIKQYPLAYIYRRAGIVLVDQADIENVVGKNECPYATLSGSFALAGMKETNPIPSDWVTSMFDPHFVPNPGDDLYYLDTAGLRNLINKVKSEISAGGGGGGGGSASVDVIPDEWLSDIFGEGLPSDRPDGDYVLDDEGLQILADSIKAMVSDKVEEKLASVSGIVLYENSYGSASSIELADSVENYKYIEIYVYDYDFNTYPTSQYPYRSMKSTVPSNKNYAVYFDCTDLWAGAINTTNSDRSFNATISSCKIIGTNLTFFDDDDYNVEFVFNAGKKTAKTTTGYYSPRAYPFFQICKVIGYK